MSNFLTFSDVIFWLLSKGGHRTAQTVLIPQQDPAQASSQQIRLGKNWLYWIVLLIISLTSKLTPVSWGGGRFLTLVDPHYFQPSPAAHSNTESWYRAFDHCISESSCPARLCKESLTGKAFRRSPLVVQLSLTPLFADLERQQGGTWAQNRLHLQGTEFFAHSITSKSSSSPDGKSHALFSHEVVLYAAETSFPEVLAKKKKLCRAL